MTRRARASSTPTRRSCRSRRLRAPKPIWHRPPAAENVFRDYFLVASRPGVKRSQGSVAGSFERSLDFDLSAFATSFDLSAFDLSSFDLSSQDLFVCEVSLTGSSTPDNSGWPPPPD